MVQWSGVCSNRKPVRREAEAGDGRREGTEDGAK